MKTASARTIADAPMPGSDEPMLFVRGGPSIVLALGQRLSEATNPDLTRWRGRRCCRAKESLPMPLDDATVGERVGQRRVEDQVGHVSAGARSGAPCLRR